MICPCAFLSTKRRPDGRPRRARAPRRNPSPKMRGGKIRHHRFSCRNHSKCRNPSHVCTPRRNPSPPLRPVMAAFAHLPTDQHPIWSDLRVLKVFCNHVFITCLAQTPALSQICLLPAKDACRNIITICTPTQRNWGFDKYSYIEQELLFFLGVASLQSMKFQRPWKMCKACTKFFLWGPSAPFSKRPVCSGLTESTSTSFCLFYKIQHKEATITVWTVLAVSAVMTVLVMTVTPLELNPSFPTS